MSDEHLVIQWMDHQLAPQVILDYNNTSMHLYKNCLASGLCADTQTVTTRQTILRVRMN